MFLTYKLGGGPGGGRKPGGPSRGGTGIGVGNPKGGGPGCLLYLQVKFLQKTWQ